MPSEKKYFGINPKFFVGVVEENDDTNSIDTQKLGRCRVRLMGVHSQLKTENDASGEGIPSDKLHWAWIVNTSRDASMNGIGWSPNGLLQGSHVLVLAMDGTACQDLYIMGSLGGFPTQGPNSQLGFFDPDEIYPLGSHLNEPDTNRLARNERIPETIVQNKRDSRQANWINIPVAISDAQWDIPQIPYAAQYPHNIVFESEFKDDDEIATKNVGSVNLDSGSFNQNERVITPNGHIVEYDATEGQERMHTYHKAGTYEEVDRLGTKVDTVVRDRYTLTHGNDFVHIKGNTFVTIDGHSSVLIMGDADLEVKGDARTLIHGDEHREVKGDRNTRIDGDDNLLVGGERKILAGGEINMSAPKINFNNPGFDLNIETLVPGNEGRSE